MASRVWAVAQRTEGGVVSAGAGFLWQVVEAAHNWTYLTELAHHSGLLSALGHGAKPSALSMIILGGAWTAATWTLKHRRHAKEANDARPERTSVVQEIKAVLRSDAEVFLEFHEDEHGIDLTILKRAAGSVARRR